MVSVLPVEGRRPLLYYEGGCVVGFMFVAVAVVHSLAILMIRLEEDGWEL